MTTFSIEEMAQTIHEENGVDISPRTIRYYIAEQVLRRPDERGKFTRAHLDRLRLILRLKQAFLPISEIREKLHLLSDGDVAAELNRYESQSKPLPPNLAAEYTQRLLANRGPASAARQQAALSVPPRSGTKAETWERITLAPDIEIHVRQPLSQNEHSFLTALLDYAGKLRNTRT